MVEHEHDKLADRFFMGGTIQGFDNKNALIKIDNGQVINWPIKNLSDEMEVGSTVRLILTTDRSDNEERERIAINVLNEVLNDQSNDN